MGLFDKFFHREKQVIVSNTGDSVLKQEKAWYERFIDDLPKEIRDCYLTITVTRQSYGLILYEVIDGEIKHSNQLSSHLIDAYEADCKKLLANPGIYIYKYENHTFSEKRHIPHFNFELFSSDLCELTIYQEYGIQPAGEERKKVLQESIKAEKIKDTLVYACYLNDSEKIFKCLEKCSKSQLNKKLNYYGTPLGICAENNNVEAFKAIAEKGADLNKISLADRPLKIAFQYSSEIVHYIYDNYREQFDKEVNAEGFRIAYRTTDVELLELLKNHGCDMECAGTAFPPLHNFADYNNVVAIEYFVKQGVDLHILNNYKQTPLDRAKNGNNVEAIRLLEKLINR